MYLDLARDLKKTMGHEGDNYTNGWGEFMKSNRIQKKQTICEQNMGTDKHNRKVKWFENMQKVLQGHEKKLRWKNTPVLADQQRLSYISSVRTPVAAISSQPDLMMMMMKKFFETWITY